MAVDTLSLAGKTAFITGSGRANGIGAAIARRFAQNGASVVIHHVSNSSKQSAVETAQGITRDFGTKTTVVQGAVEIYDEAKRMIEEALEGLGAERIDILVNNAGASTLQPLLDAEHDEIKKTFDANVYGTIYMTRAAVKVGKMSQGGRVINVGTISSRMNPLGVGVYSAAKAAQDSLTASLAGELGQAFGITVNTLAPGPIPTDMSKPYLQEADGSESAMAREMTKTSRAAERIGTVDDMADAALLLVSEKSRWITAQWISVSGGLL